VVRFREKKEEEMASPETSRCEGQVSLEELDPTNAAYWIAQGMNEGGARFNAARERNRKSEERIGGVADDGLYRGQDSGRGEE